MIHRLLAFLFGTIAASSAALDNPRPLDPRQPQGPVILWQTATGFTGEISAAGEIILVGASAACAIEEDERDEWDHVIETRQVPPAMREYNSLICLDARTGQLRWQSLHAPVRNRRFGIPAHPITSKPFIDGNRAYYLSANWMFVCVDLEGFGDGQNDGPYREEHLVGKHDADLVWVIDLQKDLGVAPRAAGDVGYIQSSPLVHEDLVYLVTGNGKDPLDGIVAPDAPSFIAVDKATGKLAWKSNAPGKKIIFQQGASPALLASSGEIVFPGGDGVLYGYDARRGVQRWRLDLNALGETERLYFETRPLVRGDTIFVSLRNSIEARLDGFAPMMALQPHGKKKLLWSFGKAERIEEFWWHSVATKEAIYTISRPNILHALDPQTGIPKWKLRLGQGGKDAMGMKLGLAGGYLFGTNTDGELMLVDPGEGGRKPKLLGTYELENGEMGAYYGRAVDTKYGVCLPTNRGVLMLQIPR